MCPWLGMELHFHFFFSMTEPPPELTTCVLLCTATASVSSRAHSPAVSGTHCFLYSPSDAHPGPCARFCFISHLLITKVLKTGLVFFSWKVAHTDRYNHPVQSWVYGTAQNPLFYSHWHKYRHRQWWIIWGISSLTTKAPINTNLHIEMHTGMDICIHEGSRIYQVQ